jgi:hypothetical protein
MNEKEAIDIVKAALEPENQGKISLKGYATIYSALQVLENFIKIHQGSSE